MKTYEKKITVPLTGNDVPKYSQEELKALLDDYKKTKKENERLKEIIKSDTQNLITSDDARIAVSRKPEYFIMGNSKLSNELSNGSPKGNALYCNINPSRIKDKSVDASVFASLRFDAEEITLPSSYSAYDREVFNAVCSLFEAGNVFIWAEQIYRTMTGKTNTEHVSPQAVEMITASMKKQMTTIITIDATKQFDEWHIETKQRDKQNKVVFYGNMLYIEGFEATVNGQVLCGWRRITMRDPILLEYNKALRQIVTVPIHLLDTTSVVRNSQEVIILKNYLLREIERMKNSRGKRSTTLPYDTMFTSCQIDAEDKIKRKRLRDSVRKILDYWTSSGYISGYSENTFGQKYVSLNINIGILELKDDNTDNVGA